MRPLIAVTTTILDTGRFGLPHVQLGVSYLRALEYFGATPLLLTPAHDAASVARLVALADGLVLTGGEDVDPSRYGQPPHPEAGPPNQARDEMEFRALDLALGRGIPVLAICRGHQLLNVALGGTLWQDLPTQRPDSQLLHEQQAPVDERWHRATVEPSTRTHAIFGTTELHINSFHHQAIDTIAPALRATAWAEDGVVEAVEAVGYGWVFGVQWHPERREAEAAYDLVDPDLRLFRAFIEAARGASGRARSAQHDEALDLV